MNDNSDKQKDEHEKSENQWTVANQLKALPFICTLIVALASLLGSLVTRQTVEATRVETGTLITNSNYTNSSSDYANPWRPWKSLPETKTLYIGLQRDVVFARPFNKAPHVSTALSLIDTKPPGEILPALGYPQPDTVLVERLRDFHVVTFATNVSETGFTLQVGIGLPTESGEFLATFLSGNKVGIDWLITRMLTERKLSDRSGLDLSKGEQWLVNFFKSVGTLDISWIAQSSEK